MTNTLPVPTDDKDWYSELPRSVGRLATIGISLMVFAFGGFGAWAFIAPLAAAVIAQGSFVATGRNKIIQHLEGGIIEEIYVSEGQFVKAGDGILSLDQTSAEAAERELRVRQLRLEATAHRLRSEYAEAGRLKFSDRLMEAAARDSEIASILDSQRLAFTVGKKTLENDLMLLSRNIEALRIRSSGYEGQIDAFRLRAEILEEEYRDKKELFDKGLIRKPELNTLRRVEAEAQGQLARLEAEVREITQTILRYEGQIERTRSAYRQLALDELQPIEAEWESVREKARQAESVLRRKIVRAPVDGTVVRLHYHTAGGVIETGKAIAEILPAEAPLIIEAQIPRTDIDSVVTGQKATVRLIALNQRTTPVLNGEVFYVSADALLEEAAGGASLEVYVARISLPKDEIGRVPGFVPTPGMPAEIMIQTQERTFAAYIAKPITDSMSRAFREN